MKEEFKITTERLDDFVVLLSLMQQMDLPGIFDHHMPRHWLQQGLSWGWTASLCTDDVDPGAVARLDHPACHRAFTGASSDSLAVGLTRRSLGLPRSHNSANRFSITRMRRI